MKKINERKEIERKGEIKIKEIKKEKKDEIDINKKDVILINYNKKEYKINKKLILHILSKFNNDNNINNIDNIIDNNINNDVDDAAIFDKLKKYKLLDKYFLSKISQLNI